MIATKLLERAAGADEVVVTTSELGELIAAGATGLYLFGARVVLAKGVLHIVRVDVGSDGQPDVQVECPRKRHDTERDCRPDTGDAVCGVADWVKSGRLAMPRGASLPSPFMVSISRGARGVRLTPHVCM